jgi:uncharacterized membrane protein YoaK (UPF0700 family)
MLNGLLTEVRDTVVPGRDPRHGPLPPLLVLMTMVTGLVDAFAVGALAGGALKTRLGGHRGRLLSATTAAQTVLLLAALVIAAVTANPVPAGYRYSLIVLLAVSMGAQNAAARALAVPDLTTTVLTLTITGIAADSGIAGGTGSRAGRRLISVAAMLAGALAGAAFVVHSQFVWPLAIAAVAAAAVAGATHLLGRSGPAWTTSPR